MHHLPNRVYYSQIVNMDDAKLRETLENVLLYGFLQIVSLAILFLVLWRRLRVSGLRQLAFVLEKQGEQVQTKLIFWVFYNVQATLQHFGKRSSHQFSLLLCCTDESMTMLQLLTARLHSRSCTARQRSE